MRSIMKRLSGATGHVLLLGGFAAYALWYANDAWSAQSKVQNMLLIGPAAALALVIIAALLLKEIQRAVSDAPVPPEDDPAADVPTGDADQRSFRQVWGTPLSAILLLVYVLSVPFVGFDIGTVTYIALCMLLQGARDWRVIVPFSLAAGLLPLWAIETILSISIPTTFL